MKNQNSKSLSIKLVYIILFFLAASTFVSQYNNYMHWPDYGFRVKVEQDQLAISEVLPEKPGEKAGLMPGDVIIEIGDMKITSDIINDFQWRWKAIKNGTLAPNHTVNMVIERKGERLSKSITPMKFHYPFSNKIGSIILFLFLSVLGFILLIKNPKSSSHILAYCLLGLAVFYAGTFSPKSMLSWPDLIRMLVVHASLFYSPLLLHFSLIHPQRKRTIEKRKFILPLIYAPWILFFAYGLLKVLYAFFFTDGKLVVWTMQLESHSELRMIIRFAAAILFIAFVLHSYFKESQEINNKRSLKLLTIGVLAGLVPILTIEFIQVFTSVLRSNQILSLVVNWIKIVLFCGTALCFALSVWLQEKNNINNDAKTDA